MTLDITTHPIWSPFKTRIVHDLAYKLQDPETAIKMSDFPNKIHQKLDWEQGGYWHNFEYTLRHIPPSADYRPAKWLIEGSNCQPPSEPRADPSWVWIGEVQIDGLIYEPTEPLRDILTDEKTMLVLMKKSIECGRSIRLAHEVFSREEEPGRPAGCTEFIVARTLERPNQSSIVVHTYSRRDVPRRICGICLVALLPVVGPNHCLDHIITPQANHFREPSLLEADVDHLHYPCSVLNACELEGWR
ncbi:hypothetical protein DFH09DRAFT_1406304 [Mycena vulgaris]|nr:hypothetical protein DFH09DRAFT_1406304 [Mycena vulgaris]